MRKNKDKLYIFGEVLFDCFPTGEDILGGAPFNVAWHLQAFGDQPTLISRVGKDNQGTRVLKAMKKWQMNTNALQVDDENPTGQVDIRIDAGEPRYDITAPSAYDFITSAQLPAPPAHGILYHGTLCLRNQVSRSTYEKISHDNKLKIFFDVNLRSPWWQREEALAWLKKAHWVKMNLEELKLLGKNDTTRIEEQMAELQTTYELEQLIVTRGEQGTVIRTAAGDFHSLVPEKALKIVDTVGAGDAFSAVYIHGLRSGWSVAQSLQNAQKFASKVIGLRGATTADLYFYQEFMTSISS